MFNPKGQRIIQIDIDDRNAGWTFPVELGLIGDAGSILGQLVEASTEASGSTAGNRSEWAGALPGRKSDQGFYEDAGLHTDSSPVLPQRVVRILQETMPAETVYALDAGNNRTWMAHLFQSQQAHTFFCPGGTAGMGWGLPASVGLQVAYPGRQVVCVTGDGGYMMTVNALSTAMQYNLPIVCVVFNDGALGMVRHHQAPGQYIASEFAETDNAAVARGFGCFGVQVADSRNLADALRDAPGIGSAGGGGRADRPGAESGRLAGGRAEVGGDLGGSFGRDARLPRCARNDRIGKST